MYSLGIMVVVSITYVIVRATGIVLPVGRAIGNTEKEGPGRGAVWGNCHSITYRKGYRQYGKKAPGLDVVGRNCIVLPIGRAIGNSEKRHPAASHSGDFAIVLPIRRAIGNTENEWLGRRAVLRNRHVIT